MLALDGQCHGGRSVEVGPQIPPEEPLAQAREQPMREVLPVEPCSPHEVMLVHGTDTDEGSGGPTATRHLGTLLQGVKLKRRTSYFCAKGNLNRSHAPLPDLTSVEWGQRV